MITARPQKSLQQAKVYFREHLSRGDYYSEQQKVQGAWFGQGVERLGLNPAAVVTEQAFLRLCENLHPLTGQKLTVRRRRDRRIFYDFAISAPKSVSVMAVTMRDERVVAAHDLACRAAIEALEKVAAARIRKKGKREMRVTGEIVAVAFRHDASRALDPQVHTHLVVFNATWDPVEQRWKALEPFKMFELSTLFTEIYRNTLARELIGIGYTIRNTVNGFEIEGVSEDIIVRFSKRSQAINAEAERSKVRRGETVTKNGRAKIARSTRQAKAKTMPPEDVTAAQRAQLTPDELARLERLRAGAHPRRPAARSITEEEAIAYARDHLFERKSVVPDHELLSTALAYGRGQVDVEELRRIMGSAEEFITVDNNLTTHTMLQEERRMVSLVNHAIGQFRPLHARFVGNEDLTAEQRNVLQGVLSSPDGVIGIRGGAGTGKTHLLAQVAHGLEHAGQSLLVFAPTAGAVEVLRKDGFAQAQTVQRLLVMEATHPTLAGKVLLVDEAGLLSTRQMLALIELAHAQRCRLILCGDTRQHGSVEAGDALRVLETQSALRTFQLNEIRRQTDAEYREAMKEVAEGYPLRAYARLERIGAVESVATDRRYAHLARDYVESASSKKSALIVAPTWREIEDVTEEVRNRLKTSGRLGQQDSAVEAHKSLRWTQSQKLDWRLYQEGHILGFHKDTKDFRVGEWGKVVRVEKDRLVLEKWDGKPAVITRKQTRCYDVAETRPIQLAVGDQLLIQSNRKSAGLLNGQIVTVKQLKRNGRIELTNGRVIPRDFRLFTYGYCVTSQAAQGKSVDHVYVAMDSQAGEAVNTKQFYVSASRGREKIKIFTDDKDLLRQAIARAGQRQSAMELVQSVAAGQRVHERPENRESINVGRRV